MGIKVMQLDKQRIFTKLKGAKEHRQTDLAIDWEGISRDQLIVLARARLFFRLQWEFAQAGEVPRVLEIRAVDYVQEDQLHEDSEPLPKKVDRGLQKLMDQLTAEEKRTLLAGLVD